MKVPMFLSLCLSKYLAFGSFAQFHTSFFIALFCNLVTCGLHCSCNTSECYPIYPLGYEVCVRVCFKAVLIYPFEDIVFMYI